MSNKKKPQKENYKKLISRIKNINLLWSAYSILGWDKEVMMPKNASDIRKMEFETISCMTHEMLANRKTKILINKARKESLSKKEQKMINQIEKYYNGAREIPTEFIKKQTKIYFNSDEAWKEAKKTNNFKLFTPHLKKIIRIERQHNKMFWGNDMKNRNAYDACILNYDTDFNTHHIDDLFDSFKEKIIPFIDKIKEAHKKTKFNNSIIEFKPDFKTQKKFCEKIAHLIGYDFKKGRLDFAVHPFTWGYGRITMKKENTLLDSVYTTLHEAGHGMYEHNLPIKFYGTPLGSPGSMIMHESQSRFWENQIGKSREFSNYLLDLLKEDFGVNMGYDEFYKTVNQIDPNNFIRIRANELTYTLHIILRYELEQFLYGGAMPVEDIPKIWGELSKQYLGIIPKTDTEGCLQDPHWANGFGYFPCYLIGDMVSSLIHYKMKNQIPGLDKKIESGKFSEINNWLKKKIHSKGETYDTKEIIQKSTGRKLSNKYHIDYLIEKYSEIYNL